MFSFDMYIFNMKVRQGLKETIFFERGWNKDQLVLSTLRDNLFDLNHVDTFSSSAFIIAKSVSMFYVSTDKHNFH